jgi:hypothetical protein
VALDSDGELMTHDTGEKYFGFGILILLAGMLRLSS